MTPDIGIITHEGEDAIALQQVLHSMGVTSTRFSIGDQIPPCDAYIVALGDDMPPTSCTAWLRSLRSPTILVTSYGFDAFAMHHSLHNVRVIIPFRAAQEVIPQLLRPVMASQSGVYLWNRKP